MKYNFVKHQAKVKHTIRKNTLRLGNNYGYIPSYLIPSGTTHITIWIDKENQAIKISPSNEGYKLTYHNAYMFSGKSLSKEIPVGNYKLQDKERIIFVKEAE